MKNFINQNLEEVLQTASEHLYPDKLGEAKVSINSTDCDGDTPLHVFIWGGETEKSLLLIDNGADINAVGDMGETPLHAALRKKYMRVVKALLKAGAQTNIVSEFRQSAIDLAQESGINLGEIT